MLGRLIAVIAGAVLFWALVSGLIVGLWDALALADKGGSREIALGYALTAAVLCLVPTLAILIWAMLPQQAPGQLILVVLGGTTIRMGFVLGGGLILNSLFVYYQQTSFWIFLLVFYLFNLALEMFVLLYRQAEEPLPK